MSRVSMIREEVRWRAMNAMLAMADCLWYRNSVGCGPVPPENPIRRRWWGIGRQNPTRKLPDPLRGREKTSAVATDGWSWARSGDQVRPSVHGRSRASPWTSTEQAGRDRATRRGCSDGGVPDARRGDHSAGVSCFDRSRNRRVAVQAQVRSVFVVVREVLRQDPTEMGLVKDDDMVEALPASGADELLDVRTLPGRLGRDDYFLDSHRLHARFEELAVLDGRTSAGRDGELQPCGGCLSFT